jgi:hypothetical protein
VVVDDAPPYSFSRRTIDGCPSMWKWIVQTGGSSPSASPIEALLNKLLRVDRQARAGVLDVRQRTLVDDKPGCMPSALTYTPLLTSSNAAGTSAPMATTGRSPPCPWTLPGPGRPAEGPSPRPGT